MSLLLLPVAGGGGWLARFLHRVRGERRQLAAALAREQDLAGQLGAMRIQALVLANSGMGMAHLKGRVVQWANPRFAEIFGVQPGHLAGASIRSFHQDLAGFTAFGRAAYPVMEQGRRYTGEIRLRRVDGSPFWAFLVGSLLVPGRPEEGAIWCLEDVSDRVEAQQELDETLLLTQKLIASSPTGILLYRASDGACLLANEAAAAMVGGTSADLLGQNFRRLPSWVEAGMTAAAEAALAAGSERRLEAAITTTFGRAAALHCTFVPFVSREERMLLLMIADVTEQAQSTAALRDSQERYRLVVEALKTDIAVRKRSERERDQLMEELEQKNKELETLVYVASHDLRSPLVNIQGFSQRLGRSLQELSRRLESCGSLEELGKAAQPLLQDRMPASLAFIRASGEKMDAIINGLLRVSRAGRMILRTERLDMNQLLASTAASMAFQLQEAEGGLELLELPPCRADPVQVAQVFSNLLDNAIKYRQGGLPLRIQVSGQLQGEAAVYRVEDNGIGIPEEQRGRIFDIFQRLDPLGATKGEGLGLTLVRRMVERNGGRVWVESHPGPGSRFVVMLPAPASVEMGS